MRSFSRHCKVKLFDIKNAKHKKLLNLLYIVYVIVMRKFIVVI